MEYAGRGVEEKVVTGLMRGNREKVLLKIFNIITYPIRIFISVSLLELAFN